MGARVTSGPGSQQTVCTPSDLVNSVEMRFGPITFDLAATDENCVAPGSSGESHFGPGSALATDGLTVDWTGLAGNLWLNPPFGDIAPWAKKCADQKPWTDGGYCRIFLLVPLTTANWAVEHVHGKALVLGLTPRVKFVGHATAFPKDLMLAVYGEPPGFEVWRWKP